MRTLLSLLLVVGIVGAFAAFTIVLPRMQTGTEHVPLVAGVVVATAEQLAEGPLAFQAELYAGRPRNPADVAPIDDDAPDPALALTPEDAPRTFAFELSAGADDAPALFVRGIVEDTRYRRFCRDVALPAVELVDGRWLVRGTRRPPPPLRITPDRPC